MAGRCQHGRRLSSARKPGATRSRTAAQPLGMARGGTADLVDDLVKRHVDSLHAAHMRLRGRRGSAARLPLRRRAAAAPPDGAGCLRKHEPLILYWVPPRLVLLHQEIARLLDFFVRRLQYGAPRGSYKSRGSAAAAPGGRTSLSTPRMRYGSRSLKRGKTFTSPPPASIQKLIGDQKEK